MASLIDIINQNRGATTTLEPEPAFTGGSLSDIIVNTIRKAPAEPVKPEFDEVSFQKWYKNIAQEQGLNPNPDDPRHFYDYRAAYEAGAMPDESGHWPSEFKLEGHPRMVIDGINTKTGEPTKTPIGATRSFEPEPDVVTGAQRRVEKPSIGVTRSFEPEELPEQIPVDLSARADQKAIDINAIKYLKENPDLSPRDMAITLTSVSDKAKNEFLSDLPKQKQTEIKHEIELKPYKESYVEPFLAGVAESTPAPIFLSEEQKRELALAKESSPLTAGAGQIAGTIGQAMLGSYGVGGLLSKTPIGKMPLIKNALTRFTVAGGVAAGQNIGRKDIKEALGDVVQQGGGGLISIVPEIVAPPGVAQLIAQPLGDLIYDVGVGAIRGQDIGSKEWWKNELVSLATSMGFAIKDVASGKTFELEQQAQRDELKKLLGGDKKLEIVPKTGEAPIARPAAEQKPVEVMETEAKQAVVPSEQTVTEPSPEVAAPATKPIDTPEQFNIPVKEEGLGEKGAVSVDLTGAGKTIKKVKKIISKYLTSKGNLPEDVFQKKLDRDHWVTAELKELDNNISDFKRTASEVYGTNRLSSEEKFKIDEVFKGQRPLTDLDPKLRPIVEKMRVHTDALSQRLIDQGVVEGDLAGVVSENMGYYANRSYRVHNDPKWSEKVPVETRNRAKAFIRDEYKQRSDAIVDKLEIKLNDLAGEKAYLQEKGMQPGTETGDQIADIDAKIDHYAQRLEQVKAKQDLPEERILGIIDNLLYKEGAPISVMASGSKLGSMSKGILRRRKDIPPEIRALWGEYKDADVNYANSVSKMAHLISNHKFLNDVKAEGLGKSFFEQEIVKGGESYSVKIAADESSAMAPLNGLYTTREIKEAFESATSKTVDPKWLRLIIGASSVAKYSKTILSPMTHLRNVTGNVGFAIANGHIDVTKAPKAVADTVKDFMNKGSKETRKYLRELTELGVIGTGARAGEIRDIINDATQSQLDVALKTENLRKFRRVKKGIEKLYGAEDDVWKIYAFENELKRYRQAYPNMLEAELKKHVANIVRNTYPTYEMIPELVKSVRKVPLIGSFVSFPAEVIRTAANTTKLAFKEIKNPATRSIGIQRLSGILTAATITGGAAAISRQLTGNNKKKDEANRTFMGPWSQNSEIVYIGKGESGKQKYIDLGYSDPHAYLKAIVIAGLRGESIDDKAISMTAEAFSPFISEDLMTQKLIDLQRNKKKDGGAIWNEVDDLDTKIKKGMLHVADALSPGILTGIKRMYMATKEGEGTFGQKYDFGTELLAQSSGIRISKLDIGNSLKYKAYQHRRDLIEASKLKRELTGGVKNEREDDLVDRINELYASKSDQEIIEAYKRNNISDGRIQAEIKRMQLNNDFRKIMRDGLVAGLTKREVYNSLRDAGITRKDIMNLFREKK